MKFIAENLIYIQSILISIALIIFALQEAARHILFHWNIFKWFVDYSRHRYRFQKYMEEREKKNE